MAADVPIPGGDVRGVDALRGTIQGAVRAGYTLQKTLGLVQDIYAQYGGRYTAATEAAVTTRFATFKALETKAQSLARVSPNIGISSRWISYATLERSLSEFANNPRFQVRYHVTGTLDGAPIDRWKTSTYDPGNNLPATVGELSQALGESAEETETETLQGASLNVSDVAIYAV